MKFKLDTSRTKLNTKKVLNARVSEELYIRCEQLAKDKNIGISDMFRQMVVFCLDNIEE